MSDNSRLTRKLRFGARLDVDDVDRLDRLARDSRDVNAGRDLVIEGEGPKFVHFVHSGIACRYKVLPDGRRAIVALLLPGDFCDLYVELLGHMDHSIGALTDCQISRVPVEHVDALLLDHPAINRACLWATLVNESILREWLVNVGRRSSDKALAHLLCELHARLDAVGLTTDHTFRMPFTQTTIGDLLGISQVHVQRTMASLRGAGLVTLQRHTIRLADFSALANLGEFDPTYLHLGGPNR